MATLIIGMYALYAGGTQDAAAQVDIPQDGQITGIDWDLESDMDADSEFSRAELSFIATNQLSQSDVRGRISSIAARMSLTTSGIALVSAQKFVGPLDLPVAGGERIYIHLHSSTGVIGTVRCNVHLNTSTGVPRRSARR